MVEYWPFSQSNSATLSIGTTTPTRLALFFEVEAAERLVAAHAAGLAVKAAAGLAAHTGRSFPAAAEADSRLAAAAGRRLAAALKT